MDACLNVMPAGTGDSTTAGRRNPARPDHTHSGACRSGSFVPTGKGTRFSIVNGTGRVAAATGSGKLTGIQDIGAGKGRLQAAGTIGY